jgi:hypothetical protein
MRSRPPIPNRDLGGGFTLNNPDDGTAITEMFTLDDGLLMVTEKCTYRLQVADQIDPERKNPALPHNFQQKLFDHGVKSNLLCRTLLQSKVLFRKEFQTIDVQRAMQLSFEALSDLVSMDEATQEFKSAETAAIEKAQEQQKQQRSLTVPAVGNVRGHCKTFMQKADHFVLSLWAIVRLFYPDLNAKGKGWEAFHELIKDRYGEDDDFAKFAAWATPVLALIRNTRDCLEHGNRKGVKTADFEPHADGTIAAPSIEIDFRKTSHDRCSISWFMDQTTKAPGRLRIDHRPCVRQKHSALRRYAHDDRRSLRGLSEGLARHIRLRDVLWRRPVCAVRLDSERRAEPDGCSLGFRFVCGHRNARLLRARTAQPVVHSGIRDLMHARVGVWIPSGRLAFRTRRGDLGASGAAPLAPCRIYSEFAPGLSASAVKNRRGRYGRRKQI